MAIPTCMCVLWPYTPVCVLCFERNGECNTLIQVTPCHGPLLLFLLCKCHFGGSHTLDTLFLGCGVKLCFPKSIFTNEHQYVCGHFQVMIYDKFNSIEKFNLAASAIVLNYKDL